jgi:hypothetical protein
MNGFSGSGGTGHDHMKQGLTILSQRYVTALRKQLKQGPQASLAAGAGAGTPGRRPRSGDAGTGADSRAGAATLELSTTKNGFTKLAEIFFTEAITPIVETHRAARQSKVH